MHVQKTCACTCCTLVKTRCKYRLRESAVHPLARSGAAVATPVPSTSLAAMNACQEHTTWCQEPNETFVFMLYVDSALSCCCCGPLLLLPHGSCSAVLSGYYPPLPYTRNALPSGASTSRPARRQQLQQLLLAHIRSCTLSH